MGKLKLQNENQDEQQEKHDIYLKKGFKLTRTKQAKNGLTIRTYDKQDIL